MCTERKATGLFVLTSFRCDNDHTFYFGRYWFSAFAKLLKIKKPVFCFDGSDWLPIKCLTRDGNQTYPGAPLVYRAQFMTLG